MAAISAESKLNKQFSPLAELPCSAHPRGLTCRVDCDSRIVPAFQFYSHYCSGKIKARADFLTAMCGAGGQCALSSGARGRIGASVPSVHILAQLERTGHRRNWSRAHKYGFWEYTEGWIRRAQWINHGTVSNEAYKRKIRR